MWRAAVAAALLAATVAACGGPAVRQSAPPGEWRANARQVVEQLRADIAMTSIGGTTPTAAGKALGDVSDLYGLLVAYSDLGGCRAMAAASEAPPRVSAPLASACAHLQRAAELFGRAARSSDPAALVRATRQASLAEPHLVRAMLAIRQAGSRGEK